MFCIVNVPNPDLQLKSMVETAGIIAVIILQSYTLKLRNGRQLISEKMINDQESETHLTFSFS